MERRYLRYLKNYYWQENYKMELNKEECKILLEHLVERQEGCFFVGNICKIIDKLKEELEDETN